MKRYLILLAPVALALVLLWACGKSGPTNPAPAGRGGSRDIGTPVPWVAVHERRTPVVYRSADYGVTWETAACPNLNFACMGGYMWDGAYYMLTTNGILRYNGSTCTVVEADTDNTDCGGGYSVFQESADGTTLDMMGWDGSAPAIFYTTTGITWTKQALTCAGGTISGMTLDGSTLYALGECPNRTYWTSADGQTWSAATTAENSLLQPGWQWRFDGRFYQGDASSAGQFVSNAAWDNVFEELTGCPGATNGWRGEAGCTGTAYTARQVGGLQTSNGALFGFWTDQHRSTGDGSWADVSAGLLLSPHAVVSRTWSANTNGAVLTSTNGITWTAVTSISGASSVYGVDAGEADWPALTPNATSTSTPTATPTATATPTPTRTAIPTPRVGGTVCADFATDHDKWVTNVTPVGEPTSDTHDLLYTRNYTNTTAIQEQSYMRFNLDTMPEGMTILSANVIVPLATVTTTGYVQAYSVPTNTWGTEITWTNKPLLGTPIAGLSINATTTPNPSFGSFLSQVEGAYTGDKLLSAGLAQPTQQASDNRIVFYGSHWSPRPKVVVCFRRASDPPGPTVTPNATATALATITPPAVSEVMPYQAGNTYCPIGGAAVSNMCAYVEMTSTGKIWLEGWGLSGAGWDYTYPESTYITGTLVTYGSLLTAGQTPIAASGSVTITNPLGTPAVTAVYSQPTPNEAWYVGAGVSGTPSPGR